MNVNISRAQILRLSNEQHARLTMIRFNHSEPFKVIAIDDRISSINTQWSMEAIRKYGQRIEILAEFPVTLADLLPEGCTRFEFNDGVLGAAYYARRFREGPHHHRDDLWNVTAIVGDAGGAFKLGDLARRFDIDLDTVIPLTVHPQHVEERR